MKGTSFNVYTDIINGLKDLIDGLVDLGIFPSRAEAGRFIFLFEYFSLLKGEFKKDYIHVPIPRIGIKRNPAKLESFREKAKIQKELWEKTINDKIRGEGEN